MVAAEFKKSLSILIDASNPKVTQAGGPCFVVSTHSGVEISKNEQRMYVGDVSDSGAEVVVELVLYIC